MIRINLVGEIGNQFFQYATCRNLAKKLNTNYYVSNTGKNYHFGVPENCGLKNNINSIFDLFDLENGKNENVFLTNFYENKDDFENIKNNTLLHGFFNGDDGPLRFNKDDIKDWFKFPKINLDFNIDDYTIIHFRGKDFIGTKYYLSYDSFYKNNMNNYENYLIVTDDIKISENEFKEINSKKIVKNDIITDLYIISQAKKLIIGNSTFAKFGKMLNKNFK